MAQLSFSLTVAKDLVQDAELMIIMKRLLAQKEAESTVNDKEIFSEIKNLLEQIKWNLNEYTQVQNTPSKAITLLNEHIMISYNIFNKNMCDKVKEKLESIGHAVKMSDNTNLEEIVKLIQGCSCFLMCVSEKYRQCITCQLEAKYAFKLNKKIVPLIMQSDYENVKGWLGQIISLCRNQSINFSNVHFDQCMSLLENEISLKEAPINLTSNLTNLKNMPPNDVNEWNESQVREWFIKNKIELSIYEYLHANSGKILRQMHQIKKSSAEFFFQSLKVKDIEFHDTILFASCLDELFK